MILFRENYKNAMNDIKADDRILNSLLSKASLKAEKKFVFNRQKIYAISTMVATVAVVLISVKTFNKANIENRVEVPEVMVENSIISQITEENINEKEENIIQEKNTKKTESVVQEQATNDLAQINEAQITADETVPETINSEDSLTFAPSNGGSSSSARAKAVPPTIEMTESEYFSYLGKNILNSLKIPDDLKKEDNVIYILKDIVTGEITQDFHKFEYRGGNGRYITISTEKSKEDSTDWEITSVNECVKAIKTIDNIKITVDHCNLSEAESEEFLNSFK